MAGVASGAAARRRPLGAILGALVLVGLLAGAFVAWRRLTAATACRRPAPVVPYEPPAASAGARRGVTPVGPGVAGASSALRSTGSFPYEPGKPAETVQRELGLERVVKLASNEGPFGPFPEALEAIARALPESNRYPDGGCYRLRRGARGAARHRASRSSSSPQARTR